MASTGALGGIKKVLGIGDSQAASLEDQVSAWVSENWPTLRDAYLIYHTAIWETFLFYANETWVEYNNSRRTFERQQMQDEWVPQPRINKFAPAIDTMASNFASVPEVEAVVKPELGGDIEAHGIAEIATALGHYFIDSNGLHGDYKSQEDKAGLASNLFVLAGCVFTNVYPEKTGELDQLRTAPQDMFCFTCTVCDDYEEVEQPPQACPKCGNPNLQVQSIQRTGPVLDPVTGEQQSDKLPKFFIRCAVGNPLFAYPRPGSLGMGSTPYFLWAEREELNKMFFEFDLELEPDTEQSDGFATTYENILNYYFMGFSSSSSKSKDSCLVRYLYVEPGKMKDFPDGVFAIHANNKVQYAKTWAEAFIEHPLTMGAYLQIPTLFFPRSVGFELVPLQREYQAYESLIKLHGMTSAVEPIVVDENTVVSEITGRADKIIKWRSIGPDSKEPHRMRHGSLDEGIYKQREYLSSQFDNTTGAVQVLKGEQPGSITAASGINSLKAQAEANFNRPTLNWNNLWRETVRKGVKNMQHFLSSAQLTEIIGPDHEDQIMNFKKCDLDAKVDFISSAQGAPRTRTERKQEMTELFDRGALDPNDVNVRQKIFELWGDTGMMENFNDDATRARWENRMMQQGQPARVMEGIEDLAVHFAIHSKAIKRLDFEKWNPEAKQLLMQHALETQQAMQMQMMQNKAAEPSKGTPSPPKQAPQAGGPPPHA